MFSCVNSGQIFLFAFAVGLGVIALVLYARSGMRVEYKGLMLSGQGRLPMRIRNASRGRAHMAAFLATTLLVLFFYNTSHNYKPIDQSIWRFYDSERSTEACGHLGPRGNVAFEGHGPFRVGFIQCEHFNDENPVRYQFNLPSEIKGESLITGFEGTFFIDEAGPFKQTNVQATWEVVYNGTLLCSQVKARFGRTGRCQMTQPVIVNGNGSIEIVESVRGKDPRHRLFAGIYLPGLELQEPC
jgi:hypothetical protein